MNSTAVFCPRPDLSCKENLAGFIQTVRSELHVFGASLDFDSNVWDLTDFLDLKGRGNKRVRVYFCEFTSKRVPDAPLAEPFCSFAKAYYRYMHSLRPKKFVQARMCVLKAVYEPLQRITGGLDITGVNTRVFDAAAEVLRLRFDEALAYRIGAELEQLAVFLTENRLTRLAVRWVNTLPRPCDTERVGKEFDERRAAKMPSQAALDALPEVFLRSKEPLSVIGSSITAILLSAPGRISEVLLLPVNCEVVQSDSRVLLRWWPSKGAKPTLKPMYTGMTEVIKQAISHLRVISEPARIVAAWYEAHPHDLFLPPGTEHLRGKKHLTMKDVESIVGVQDGRQWCRHEQLELRKDGGNTVVQFRELERAILSLLPIGFPVANREVGRRYSECLILVRKNELHSTRATYLCMIEPVTTDTVNLALGAKDRSTMFSKLGLTEPDGSPIKITTHQFRHYLSTIAKLGGLGELEIAKWAGRVDIRQNAAYDHVTSDEMLVKIRAAVGEDSLIFGPLGKAPDRRLITRDEFAQLKVRTAHVTEIGFCIHDFTMAPCDVHRDCINCEELVCVKAHGRKTEHIRKQLEQARVLLRNAQSGTDDGDFGADRWLCHQRATVERLEQLCGILDDPSVPVGTLITLARPAPVLQSRTPEQELLPGLNEATIEEI